MYLRLRLLNGRESLQLKYRHWLPILPNSERARKFSKSQPQPPPSSHERPRLTAQNPVALT